MIAAERYRDDIGVVSEAVAVCVTCGEEARHQCELCGDYKCARHLREFFDQGDAAACYAPSTLLVCAPGCEIGPLAVAQVEREMDRRFLENANVIPF